MAAKEFPWDGICLFWLFKDQVHNMIPPNTPKSLNTQAVQIIHNWCTESKNELKQAMFENKTRQEVLFSW